MPTQTCHHILALAVGSMQLLFTAVHALFHHVEWSVLNNAQKGQFWIWRDALANTLMNSRKVSHPSAEVRYISLYSSLHLYTSALQLRTVSIIRPVRKQKHSVVQHWLCSDFQWTVTHLEKACKLYRKRHYTSS